MPEFITFEKVEKTYKVGEMEIHALKDASFSVKQGEICVIVGASGAGKTTLLNIFGGMDNNTFADAEKELTQKQEKLTEAQQQLDNTAAPSVYVFQNGRILKIGGVIISFQNKKQEKGDSIWQRYLLYPATSVQPFSPPQFSTSKRKRPYLL